jgi:hypothetical protein
MDEFRLRSLDEFDSDFVASVKEKSSAPSQGSLIPEFEIKEADPGQQTSPAVGDKPLYTPEKMSNADVEPLIESLGKEPEYETEKPKLGAGAIVGKIIAIVLLVATVLVFVCGCFISIFLDNKGSTVFGMSLNTLAHDTTLNNNVNLKKGDLLISSRKADADYTEGSHLAVPTADTASKGCDIVTITQVTVQEGDEAYVVRQPGDNFGVSSVYTKDTSYGVVTRYVPHIGGLLGFAMDNAIWFCAMFVLLAAVCICVLVLINWTAANKVKEPKDEENTDKEVAE